MKLLAVLLAFFVMGSAATAQQTRTLHDENPVSVPSPADEVMIYHGTGCLGKLICKTTFQSVFTSMGLPPGSFFLGPSSNNGNTFFGTQAGQHITAPGEHLATAIGWNALGSTFLSDGTLESTAVGWNSQGLMTTGSQNTTLGINTLGTCLGCIHSVAIGTDSMRNTISGQGQSNQSGQYNVGIGVTTLISTNAWQTVAIGDSAYRGPVAQNDSGHESIAIGWETMEGLSATTGYQNIAIGNAVMAGFTSAVGNVIVGHNAGLGILGALGDSCMGYQCLYADAGNGVNTAFGYQSGKSITAGNFNICFGGTSCSTTLSTGSDNLMVGYGADTPAGSTSHTMAFFSQAGGQILGVTGTDTPSTSAAVFAGTLGATGGFKVGAAVGVTCSGSPTSSFASVDGIVTHC